MLLFCLIIAAHTQQAISLLLLERYQAYRVRERRSARVFQHKVLVEDTSVICIEIEFGIPGGDRVLRFLGLIGRAGLRLPVNLDRPLLIIDTFYQHYDSYPWGVFYFWGAFKVLDRVEEVRIANCA